MYTVATTARLIGRSPDTLRKWDMKGIYLARRDRCGRRWYNDQDLVELRQLAATRTRRAGRLSANPTTAQTMDRLLRLRDVRHATGLSSSSIYALAARGEFPQSVKLTGRSVAWVEEEVVEWIEARKNSRTRTN